MIDSTFSEVLNNNNNNDNNDIEVPTSNTNEVLIHDTHNSCTLYMHNSVIIITKVNIIITA